MEVNVLLRGQSNALLFADYGGAWEMERQLEQELGGGIDVRLIYQWGDAQGRNTVNSGSAFMAWDTDGKQAGFMEYLNGLPEDVQDNPTITLWMHNEDEMKNNPATADWVREVRTDAAMVRDALGQDAATTPYLFTWVPYNYGSGTASVQAGMRELAADSAFNADLALGAMDGIAMDGDGYPNSSHMGRADAQLVAARLADALAPMVSEVAGGGNGGGSSPQPGPSEPSEPATDQAPVNLGAGSGTDALVLKISQDAYQGDSQYTVSVDGVQVGGAFTASASHAAGRSDTLTLMGDWGAGEHEVEVSFLNDKWDGTAETDRNLYVDGATYNGEMVEGAAQAIMGDAGPGSFPFAEAAPPEQPAPVVQVGTDGSDLFDARAAGGVFTGGDGRDLFVFEAGDGHVTIKDFASRTDKLVFVDFGKEDVATAAATEDGAAGLMVTYGEGGSVFLAGVTSLAARDLAFG